jgi:hypothetical protein
MLKQILATLKMNSVQTPNLTGCYENLQGIQRTFAPSSVFGSLEISPPIIRFAQTNRSHQRQFLGARRIGSILTHPVFRSTTVIKHALLRPGNVSISQSPIRPRRVTTAGLREEHSKLGGRGGSEAHFPCIIPGSAEKTRCLASG